VERQSGLSYIADNLMALLGRIKLFQDGQQFSHTADSDCPRLSKVVGKDGENTPCSRTDLLGGGRLRIRTPDCSFN
jgi:hypothetical protein